MILNEELLAVQRGEQGEAMRKVLNTLVMYGEAFGAERMVKITGKMGHAVIGTGSMTWKPVFDLMEELIDGGALPRQSFTTDPRGVESHVPMSLKDRAMFKVIFSGQKRMEQEWERMGSRIVMPTHVLPTWKKLVISRSTAIFWAGRNPPLSLMLIR